MSEPGRAPRRPEAYERWTDRQVREAIASGQFDDLSGAGRPLPDLDEPHDDHRWLRKKLADEDVAVLPPSLLLRREVEQLFSRAGAAAHESEVAALVEQANTKIRRANRLGVTGPPHNLVPYDVDAFVDSWRKAASGPVRPRPAAPPTEGPPPFAARRRRSWLRRRSG